MPRLLLIFHHPEYLPTTSDRRLGSVIGGGEIARSTSGSGSRLGDSWVHGGAMRAGSPGGACGIDFGVMALRGALGQSERAMCRGFPRSPGVKQTNLELSDDTFALVLAVACVACDPVQSALLFLRPPLSGGIGSRQQKQRLRAPRRRSRPPSRGGCRRSGRLSRPRPSALPRRSRRGAPSRG